MKDLIGSADYYLNIIVIAIVILAAVAGGACKLWDKYHRVSTECSTECSLCWPLTQ